MYPHVPRLDRLQHAVRCSSMAGSFNSDELAPACSRTMQSWRERALTLSLLGMGAPATVAQPATAQPRSHACHAHAPRARDGAQHAICWEPPREDLMTFSARRRVLSVASVRL